MPDRLLQPEDVAEILGVSTRTLAQWRTKKLYLRYYQSPARQGKHDLIGYDPRDLEEFLKSIEHLPAYTLREDNLPEQLKLKNHRNMYTYMFI